MNQLNVFTIFFVVLFLNFKVNNGFPTTTAKSLTKESSCNACNALVSFFDRLSMARIDDNSESILTIASIRICNDYSQLPGQQSTNMCKHIVRDLFGMFKNVNRETFCSEISACHHDHFDANSLTREVDTDNVTCDFCQNVVTNVKDIVSGKQTELEVKYLVEDACHYLGSFENECVSLSDEYLDTLFAFLQQNLQPLKFCQSIGACPRSVVNKNIEKIAEISEIVNIFPANLPLVPLEEAKPAISDDIECMLCKKLVTYVVEELKDNRTEAAIIEALDRVCSLFPRKDRAPCISFVSQYTNELIHILTEETDPGLACTLMGVCLPKTFWKISYKPYIERENEQIESQNNKWHDIEVESSDIDKSEIETKFDVIHDITTESPKTTTPRNTKLCYECELIMHFIQNEIYDYNNEEQIEEFVENILCDRLSVVITKQACDNFVREYGPQVMQIIAQRVFDPSTVCQKELKLCPNTNHNPLSEHSPSQDFSIDRVSEKCDLCIQLVQQMDTLLENEQFDKEVAKIVEKTCKTLPKQRQVECELMVEAFAPYFLQMIGHLSNANQICTSIDMCYKPGNVQLLGGHKCTFGPSYWCHTIAHAESCKATHFCKNKVWKAMP